MRTYYFIACLLFIIACKKNEPEKQVTACTSSYQNDIAPLVNSKCAISGCHGSNGLANLADYSILKARADNGNVKKFVFELQMMPPSAATQLTDAEKEKLKCWLDNGALQN